MAEEKKGFFKGLLDKLAGTDETSLPSADDFPPPETGNTAEQKKPGLFERLRKGLAKTHESLVGRIDQLLLGKKEIDAETLEELEEILITADIGVSCTVDLVRTLEERLKRNELQDGEALRKFLKEEILARLSLNAAPWILTLPSPL